MRRWTFGVAATLATATACGDLLGIGDSEEDPPPEAPDASAAEGGSEVGSDAGAEAGPDAADASACRALLLESFEGAWPASWPSSTTIGESCFWLLDNDHPRTGARGMKFVAGDAGGQSFITRPVTGACSLRVALWVQPLTPLSGATTLVRVRNTSPGGVVLAVAVDDAMTIHAGTQVATVTGTLTSARYHHLVVTYAAESGTATVEVDDGGAAELSISNGASPTHVDVGLVAAERPIEVVVDDVRIE